MKSPVESAAFRVVSKRLGLPPPAVRNVAVRRAVRIPLADGVHTLADHWTPVGVDDPPLVLLRSPYGRKLFNLLFGRTLAHHGFQVMVQSSRGTAGSEGTFDRPFTCEIEDGAATVSWLRSQPWYPGRFFTFGESYLGWNQVALAPAAGHDLAGMVLRVAPTSLYDMIWPNGSLNYKVVLTWALLAEIDPSMSVAALLRGRRITPKVTAAGMTAPLASTYRSLSRRRIAFYEDWVSHPSRSDTFWDDSEIGHYLDNVTCPVLVIGGWYDLFVEDSISQYERVPGAELLLGPWTHADLLGKALGPTMADAIAFLRAVAGLEDRPPIQPVRLTEINGSSVTMDTWPPAPVASTTWFLGPDGSLGDTQQAVSRSYRFDPADPTPYVGGALNDGTSGSKDNTSLEKRADVLTFTTAPLPSDLHVVGSPKVTLSLTSDRSDTSVLVRLCEVKPDGTSWNHGDRCVRLTADERGPDGWDIDVTLPPTLLRLAAGHRVRLQLSSGAYPRYPRHPGTGESPVLATAFHPATQTVVGGSVTLPLRAAPGNVAPTQPRGSPPS